MTHKLCFITWSHAYSLIPYPTFVLKQTYLVNQPSALDREDISRFLRQARQVGLKVEPIDIRDTQRDGIPLDDPEGYIIGYRQSRVDDKARCVSEKRRWIIPLNTEGIQPSTTPIHLITRAAFRFSPHVSPADDDNVALPFNMAHYDILADVVSAPCLKYQYISYCCQHNNRALHVCPKRYQDISALQIESVAVEDRPPGYGTLASVDYAKRWKELAGAEYQVPAYWRYYDDEVEKILESRYGGGRWNMD